MFRLVILVLLLGAPLWCQTQGKIVATNDTPDGSIVTQRDEPKQEAAPGPPPVAIVKPTRDELDAPDMKRVLSAQVQQQHWRAEAEKYRAEMEANRARMNEAEQELRLWNKEIDNLLVEMRIRYNCPGCALLRDMKWKVPDPPKADVKP